MVDAGDLKSPGWRVREGSIPSRPTEDQAISLEVSPDGTIRLNGLGLTDEQQDRVHTLLWFWHSEASKEFVEACAAYAAKQSSHEEAISA